MLDDEFMVQCGPDCEALARVIAIGLDQAAPGTDARFYEWAMNAGQINDESVVVQWVGTNPLYNKNPQFAPVGRYLTLNLLCCESFVRRGGSN